MPTPVSIITKEMMDDVWNGTSITYRDIKKASSLFPIQATLNKQYGAGNWGVDEIGAQLLKSRAGRADKKTARKVVETKEVYHDLNRSVDKRVDAYISHFEGVTPNDIQAFRQMAVLETQMAEVETRLHDAGLLPDELKKYGELYSKLSGEFRQLQTSLGIDRASRETQVDTAEELKKMMKGAQELLKKHGVPIICPKCREDNVKINQGFVMFHFRQDVTWTWTSQCPKCGSMIVLGEEHAKIQYLDKPEEENPI